MMLMAIFSTPARRRKSIAVSAILLAIGLAVWMIRP